MNGKERQSDGGAGREECGEGKGPGSGLGMAQISICRVIERPLLVIDQADSPCVPGSNGRTKNDMMYDT